MESLPIDQILLQLPNFGGLLIALYVSIRNERVANDRINYLIDVIVKRENCEDDLIKPA